MQVIKASKFSAFSQLYMGSSGKMQYAVSIRNDEFPQRLMDDQLRRQNEYLTLLHETTLAMLNRMDFSSLLNVILTRAAALVGAPHGSICIQRPGEGVVRLESGIGTFDKFVGRIADMSRGTVARAWSSGQTIVVDDYHTWPERKLGAETDMLHATVSAPLKVGQQVIGVISLSYSLPDQRFSAEALTLLDQFAELAALVLDHAALYYRAQQELVERERAEQQLRQLNAELEERVERRTSELQQERLLLETILDEMGEGMIYSREGRVSYANQSFRELSGFSIEDLAGEPMKSLASITALPEEIQLLSEGPFSPRGRASGEVFMRRKDGPDFNAAVVVTHILEPDGRSQGTVIIIRDITEEKQLQAQKTRFIANASHELRTPLTNLKTRLYLTRRQPEQLVHHLTVLEQLADYMTSLVEDLLDISRFERGTIKLEPQSFDLKTLVAGTVENQQPEAARKNITLTLDLPESPVYVHVDSKRLVQVLINLLTNAINYTPQGGIVSVRLALSEQNSITQTVLSIQDSGIGIAPQHLARIFEPFFRVDATRGPGTGLGLSISREIVERLGGSLVVESTLGEGSTFSLQLPALQSVTL
jgi:PAS domain S-box-containing protein